MEWSERGSGVKSTVSDRVITIKWSNDSAEKGIETSFPIERSYSLDRGGGILYEYRTGGKKKGKNCFSSRLVRKSETSILRSARDFVEELEQIELR